MRRCVYLDYNATTPVLDEVIREVVRFMKEEYGNPGSGHAMGREAKKALEKARKDLAALINASPEEVVFVSGGTEANNLAVFGSVFPKLSKGKKVHALFSRIEHPSVLEPATRLLALGVSVEFVPVDGKGYVDPDEVKKRLRPETVLVSVMFANNETGAIQPVRDIALVCKEAGVVFHTDAAQAVGKVPVSVKEVECDLLTIAGHKMYAPKGVGALFVRRGLKLSNILFGASQEFGLRPGTEPVPLAVGLGKAAEVALRDLIHEAERQKTLREKLWEGILEVYPKAVRHGDPERTLPNTLLVSFPGKVGFEVLRKAEGICATTGSACHDSKKATSHVLSAMGVPEEVALGTVRFSLGRFTSLEDIELAVEILKEAL